MFTPDCFDRSALFRHKITLISQNNKMMKYDWYTMLVHSLAQSSTTDNSKQQTDCRHFTAQQQHNIFTEKDIAITNTIHGAIPLLLRSVFEKAFKILKFKL